VAVAVLVVTGVLVVAVVVDLGAAGTVSAARSVADPGVGAGAEA
jgi:hypothetical protein